MEHPTLRLGLVGFGHAEAQRIGQWLARLTEGWPHWRLSAPDRADAWWIDGRCISKVEGDELTVQTGLIEPPWIKLNPANVDRPIAFAGPLPSGMRALELVNPGDEAAVRQQVQRFEGWLRPLRAQFALGAELVERETEIKSGVYHLTLQGRLQAVVDLNHWRAALLASARPVDFTQAMWEPRPDAASTPPGGFIRMSISQLMWIYASRTRTNILPARYLSEKIYLRQVPRLPVGWLHDEHLLVLREVSAHADTLDRLVRRTGLTTKRLSRLVAALYFSGAVTTSRGSAAKARSHSDARASERAEHAADLAKGPVDAQNSDILSSRLSGFGPNSHRLLSASDLTAPAPLQDS